MTQEKKDIYPEETVKKIKGILDKVGIYVKEKWISSDACNNQITPSVVLNIVGLDFKTYGKGTSKNYALASAYGEFLERIENIAIVRSMLCQTPSDKFYLRFTDAIPFAMDKLEKNYASTLNNNINKYKINKLNSLVNLSLIKYVHVNSLSINFIPDEFTTWILTGSNGMCAGNTYSEAICKGIFEIFERNVLKILYFDNGAELPIVDEDIIKNFTCYKTILTMQRSGVNR